MFEVEYIWWFGCVTCTNCLVLIVLIGSAGNVWLGTVSLVNVSLPDAPTVNWDSIDCKL